MAGGFFGPKKDPKGKPNNKQLFSHEALHESGSAAPKQDNKGIFGLSGILRPGSSVEFNRSQENKPWGQEYLAPNHLVTELESLHHEDQQQLKKEVEELIAEIKKLIVTTEDLKDNALAIAAEQPIIEVTDYQLSFLKRIKNLIAQFRINVSQASNCLEMFQSRKKKKNAFWNKARDKKKGGEQYLMSNEHSAARSAT